jgi:hypothetical protein
MDRSELQFTLADLVCAMLLLSALIGTLATHADHAHYIWYYLPVLVVCEVAGFVISYAIFRGPRARRSAITAVWTTTLGSLIGIVLPIVVLTMMSVFLPFLWAYGWYGLYLFVLRRVRAKHASPLITDEAELQKLRARILEQTKKE